MKTINRDQANPNNTKRIKSLLIEDKLTLDISTVKLFLQ